VASEEAVRRYAQLVVGYLEESREGRRLLEERPILRENIRHGVRRILEALASLTPPVDPELLDWQRIALLFIDAARADRPIDAWLRLCAEEGLIPLEAAPVEAAAAEVERRVVEALEEAKRLPPELRRAVAQRAREFLEAVGEAVEAARRREPVKVRRLEEKVRELELELRRARERLRRLEEARYEDLEPWIKRFIVETLRAVPLDVDELIRKAQFRGLPFRPEWIERAVRELEAEGRIRREERAVMGVPTAYYVVVREAPRPPAPPPEERLSEEELLRLFREEVRRRLGRPPTAEEEADFREELRTIAGLPRRQAERAVRAYVAELAKRVAPPPRPLEEELRQLFVGEYMARAGRAPGPREMERLEAEMPMLRSLPREEAERAVRALAAELAREAVPVPVTPRRRVRELFGREEEESPLEPAVFECPRCGARHSYDKRVLVYWQQRAPWSLRTYEFLALCPECKWRVFGWHIVGAYKQGQLRRRDLELLGLWRPDMMRRYDTCV